MEIFNAIRSLFGESISCPACGAHGAKKRNDGIRCSTPGCLNYELSRKPNYSETSSPIKTTAPADFRAERAAGEALASSCDLAVRYLNFRKEAKTFYVDSASVKRKNNHILARERRSGRQIALSRNRIQNMSEVDLALPAQDRSGVDRPTAREKQVLGYHAKYKTTSPLYLKIRAKYPDW